MSRTLFANATVLCALTLANSAVADDVVVHYDPTGTQYSHTTIGAASVATGFSASGLAPTGMVSGYYNVGVKPVGFINTSSQDTGQYLSFTITPADNTCFSRLTYAKASYGSGPTKAAVRTNADGYAANVAAVSGLAASGYSTADFDLGVQADSATTFRIYFYDSAGADWADLASSDRGQDGLVLWAAPDDDFDGDGIFDDCDDDDDNDGVDDVDDDCLEDPDDYYGYDVGPDGCISDLVGSGCPAARASRSNDTDFNNMADEWGILARRDATFTGGSSEGTLRVFGDGDLYSFNVGSDPISGYSYAGRGDLYARSGTFAKDVRAATIDVDETVSIYGSSTESAFGGHISDYMRRLSYDLSNHNINGDTTLYSWGTIEFTGDHPMMNTFEVSAADFAASTYMTIDVPEGSSAVVNVTGSSADFGPTGVTLYGLDATDVVYNFWGATSLELDGVSVQGQVLAPNAVVDLVTGDITGTLTGLDLDGTITQYNAPFDGRACAVVDAKAGPECTVTHTVTSSWGSGYNASVTVTNTGSAASSWEAGWTFTGGESVSSGWGGAWSQSGADVTVANASWNGALGTGGSVTIGYTGSGSPAALSGLAASCE